LLFGVEKKPTGRQTMKSRKRILLAAVVVLGSCEIKGPEIRQTCHLPILRTKEITQVVSYIGDDGAKDSCPVRVPKIVAVPRDYGVLYLEWTLSTPWLLMRASSKDDRSQYVVTGPGVEPYRLAPTDHLKRVYTNAKLFPGNSFDREPPGAQPFSVSIGPAADSPEQFSDEVLFEFDTVECTCVYRDY
jgi:hypothetical protein